MRVHSRTAQQGRVLQEGHQLNRTGRVALLLSSRLFRGSWLLAPFGRRSLRVTVTAQPGGERPLALGLPELLLLRVVDDAVALEALPHGEGLPAAPLGTGEGPKLLVEGADVALQVKKRGIRPAAAVPGALEDHARLGVDALMLLQEPGVPEHLVALVAHQDTPVLLLPVLQVLCPGLSCEAAALVFAGVPSMHLLVALQLAGDGEPHLAVLIGARVRGQLRVLLAHVGLELLVLLELEPAVLELAGVLLLLPRVNAADMSGPVGVGGEGLLAAVLGAPKGLHAAVTEFVSRHMVGAAERLTATVARAREGLHSGVFTQVCVEFPLFVVSRRAAGDRADVPFERLRFSFHHDQQLTACKYCCSTLTPSARFPL